MPLALPVQQPQGLQTRKTMTGLRRTGTRERAMEKAQQILEQMQEQHPTVTSPLTRNFITLGSSPSSRS